MWVLHDSHPPPPFSLSLWLHLFYAWRYSAIPQKRERPPLECPPLEDIFVPGELYTLQYAVISIAEPYNRFVQQ